MINLLDPNELKQIRAARMNVRLRRFLISTILTLGVITGIYLAGYKLAESEYATAEVNYQQSQKQLTDFASVTKEAGIYRANLDVAKKILGNEISFSTFMTDLAKLLPPNVVIADLTLTTQQKVAPSAKNVTQLHARAKSWADVLALKTALEQSKMFSDVRIESTSSVDATKSLGTGVSAYPVQVTYSIVIKQYRETTQ